jgi:hypothetical protein
MIERWGTPVERGEWGMTPQTVNAYYSAVNNEIVFPRRSSSPRSSTWRRTTRSTTARSAP